MLFRWFRYRPSEKVRCTLASVRNNVVTIGVVSRESAMIGTVSSVRKSSRRMRDVSGVRDVVRVERRELESRRSVRFGVKVKMCSLLRMMT